MSTALLLSISIGTAGAQTLRVVRNLQLWPELQGELGLKGKGELRDYLLLSLRGQRETNAPGYVDAERTLGFDERRVTLGYEHFWSSKWSGGATFRYQLLAESTIRIWTPELLLRHRSALGPLTFGQRLGVERRFIDTNSSFTSKVEAENWLSLRLDLEKQFPLGRLSLRPRLSYEAATHLRLQKEDTDPDERTIQFTSLRAEVGVRLTPYLDLTPWFAYQTNYLLTLPQYDAQGRQTSGGKLNQVSPVLGLEARFSFGQPADGQNQLPTQH